jgi:CheY-like chemotaxis protein
MIANLLDNASKYTPEQGQISVSARLDGDQVEIVVRDTGIGIPADQIGAVFDLYTQIESRAAGFGLGLKLVRDLAVLHGGSVDAASEGPGLGSQFTIRLPTIEAPRASSPPGPIQPAPPSIRRRILVVEDNEDAAESIAMMLRLDAHEVSVAHDGSTALRMRQSFNPDVILLDVGLPDIDGYEVVRRIRKDIPATELTIIALSGYGRETDRAQSLAAGCDAHLVKPVDPEVLRRVLDELPLQPRGEAVE